MPDVSSVIILLVLIVAGMAIYTYRRGVRDLTISEGGIAIGKEHGGKTQRLAWDQLASVSVERRGTGPTWTFTTRSGEEIRWVQTGLRQNQRLEIERALINALGRHGIRING